MIIIIISNNFFFIADLLHVPDALPLSSSVYPTPTTTHQLSQMSYSLVVILELSGVSEVQYKEIMIIGDE